MTVEVLQRLSLIAYLLGGAFLILGIVLFFVLNIPKLLGDVSGRTARKTIEKIRQQNAEVGERSYRPSPVNAERGRVTDKIARTGTLPERKNNSGIGVETERLRKNLQRDGTKNVPAAPSQGNETTILAAPSSETTVLPQSAMTAGEQITEAAPVSKFSVDVEISFTGSSEIIE